MMKTTTRTAVVLACLSGLALGAGGCSTGKVPEGRDAQVDMLSPERQLNERTIALEQSWREAREGLRSMPQVRENLKQLIWKGSAPDSLRVRALELLLTDESPEAQADTRNMMRLRLPTETSWPLITAICRASQDRAGDPAWREMTAALVRSYARKVPSPTDDQRPERAALLALHPGQPLERTVFGVFLRPVENGATTRIADWPEKSRDAAWELLGRLDPDGSARAGLLAGEAAGDPSVQMLSRAAREMGVVPLTGSELRWLERLLDPKNAGNSAWWNQTSSAVQRLSAEQRAGLQMRHLEAVRWASEHRAEWIASTREQLVRTLSARMEGRRIHRKTEGVGIDNQISREALEERAGELNWGDALTLLIIDEALRDPAVTREMFLQAEADRADSSTEYGGVLSWENNAWRARSFPPRPAQRVNDRTFVASEELFLASDRALAHYHFHTQTPSNAAYAGPGRGDLDYADTHGRSCIVLTSVRGDTLNADYYQRGGAVVDTGELTR